MKGSAPEQAAPRGRGYRQDRSKSKKQSHFIFVNAHFLKTDARKWMQHSAIKPYKWSIFRLQFALCILNLRRGGGEGVDGGR
jgi:hypothetical protein